jgi:hypothetical protein
MNKLRRNIKATEKLPLAFPFVYLPGPLPLSGALVGEFKLLDVNYLDRRIDSA